MFGAMLCCIIVHIFASYWWCGYRDSYLTAKETGLRGSARAAPSCVFVLCQQWPCWLEVGPVNHLPKPHSEGGAEPDSNLGLNNCRTSGLSVQRPHRNKKQLNLVFSPSLGKVILTYSEIKCRKYGILSKMTATSEGTASICV